MPFRVSCILALICLLVSSVQAQKTETNFPKDDEILLVMDQAERATTTYKALLEEQETVSSTDDAESIAKDRKLIHLLEATIVAIRKDSQYFNTHVGFVLFELLNDASRVAAVRSATSLSSAISSDSPDKSASHSQLAKEFMLASSMLNSVSENAGALYTRYVEGEEEVARQGVDAATKCSDIMKNMLKDKPSQK